ncbi:hypothetical protein G4B88_004547 [Cannabis sativa]|uniref:Disease resistance N-terminal domain-containing protein n=1 Tax=Cannabis sativa TaxID=3483 RepID=A0A7J6DRX7_CANSA|nr:hypothetical protein G4B88_004547 [Cannabis sativa]
MGMTIVSNEEAEVVEEGNEKEIASPYVEEFFFKAKNESASVVSQRLFKMKSTFNSLAAVRFEVENKRIKNPAVEKWLDDLLDAVDDAEDFFGDIQYNAMKPDKADESKKEKRKAISKLLSCFSKPSNSADRVRNANMEAILKRLEYVANQIGNFNLEKNVGEVKPTERLRLKTSLPDEPKLYEQNDDIDRLQKKTRHLGCVMELSTDKSLYEAIKPRNSCFTSTGCLPATLTPLIGKTLQELHLRNCGSSFTSFHLDLFPNLKTLHIGSSHYFEAVSMSDGISLEELTFFSIKDCVSFVSFPDGGLIAPKLSELEIINCPNLKWLAEMMISLSSLESLIIRDCPLIEPCPENEGGLPVCLISGYELDCVLVVLEGQRDSFFNYMNRAMGLDKKGLTQLTSLQTLEISECPELETLSEEGRVSNLPYLFMDLYVSSGFEGGWK